MKNSRMLAVLLVPLLAIGLAAVANAFEKDPEHGPTVDVPLAGEAGRAVGDDCTDPFVINSLPYYGTGFTTCGALNNYDATCLGSYDGGEDVIFQLNITQQVTVNISLDPLGTATWTGLAIDDECPLGATCIATATGSAGPKLISNLTLAPGTYYIMVDTWPSPTCIPQFNLTIEPPPPPPENDLCSGAIVLERCTTGSVAGDLTLAANNYDPGVPGPSCTGYAAAGKDVVYKVDLLAGDNVNLVYTTPNHDGSIYIVTDCDNVSASCVVGEDDPEPETINWTATAAGTYYIICDAYGANAGGAFTLAYTFTCPPPVGACCFADGSCQLLLEADCLAQGGLWYGPTVGCDPNPCPQPQLGACCFPDGTCLMLPRDPCGAQGGLFVGGPCDPNPCPQPQGICCFPDGSCQILTESECLAQGGVWNPSRVATPPSCDPNPCPQPPPVGACCFIDGSCQVLTELECADAQGQWYGATEPDCDPNPCPPPVPVERTTWGQIKSNYR